MRRRAVSNSIKAPAVGASVRSVLLIDRHPDALGKSVSTVLIAFDDAPIFVGKSDRPRGSARRFSR
jgi:hypothetical protein